MSRPRHVSSGSSAGGKVIVNRTGRVGGCGPFRITNHMPSAAMRRPAAKAMMASRVTHHTERPNIRAPVHRATLGLLGTHVGRCAQNDPCSGARGRDRRRVGEAGRLGVAADSFCEAKVEYLHLAIRPQFDIGRFQVTMHDAAFVRRFQRFGDLPRDGQGVVQS